MRKYEIKARIMLMVIILGVVLFSAACTKKNESFSTEDFFYKIEGDSIRVTKLTQEGCEKREIIIPPFVDGREVKYMSEDRTSPVAPGFAHIESDKLVRFYAPYSVVRIEGYEYNGPYISGEKLEAIFYASNIMFESKEFSNEAFKRVFRGKVNVYVTPKSYKYLLETYVKYYNLENVFPANVSYLFNYENSPNDNYYFIDQVSYGSGVRNAPKPTREGYEFNGWYKDAECINKWEFGVDKTPEAIRDEEGKTVYQETKLYAKWIKK